MPQDNGIQGTSELVNRLRTFGGNVDVFIKNEIEAAGFDLERIAKENASNIADAPSDLKQGISKTIEAGGYQVVVRQNTLPIGAYYEFGTGVFVKVADEWKDMAWQFYVNGKGVLPPSPYLYPAFVKVRSDLNTLLLKKLNILIARS